MWAYNTVLFLYWNILYLEKLINMRNQGGDCQKGIKY